MKLTITSSRVVTSLDISDDLEVENLKAFCEAQTDIPASEMTVLHEGKNLSEDKKTVSEYGLKDGDMIFVERRRASSQAPGPPSGGLPLLDFSSIRVPGPSTSSAARKASEDDPQFVKEMLKSNPDQLALLRQNNPRLAEAYDAGLEAFAKVLQEQQQARAERERLRLKMLTADPFDMEAQKLIAQEIENKNIDQNMELAMEYNPESFATVIMLYIDCKVNGHHIKAFVDSGAQATIMSRAAAERCGIMRLVDKRWSGIAKGVGVQKIIGRVHMAQIQIKDDFLATSFSILEEQPMDMLLGLDMLKRHQCSIDLKKNVLVIGTTGTETKFLSESELPECARLSGKSEAENKALEASVREEEEKQLNEALAKSESECKRQKNDNNSPSESGSILPTDKFTEENVRTLMNYGFAREKCLEELRRHNGDMTQATAALFAKSLKFN